jgi:hypothetical protein
MAKILEDIVIIKFSKIVKDNTGQDNVIANDEMLSALEQVAQELAGDNIIVELVKE